MGVSPLRAAACAGMLVCGLVVGNSATGIAIADTGATGEIAQDGESSKDIASEHAGSGAQVLSGAGEHEPQHLDQPPTAFGSGREDDDGAGETAAATFSEIGEPAPEVAPKPNEAPTTMARSAPRAPTPAAARYPTQEMTPAATAVTTSTMSPWPRTP